MDVIRILWFFILASLDPALQRRPESFTVHNIELLKIALSPEGEVRLEVEYG